MQAGNPASASLLDQLRDIHSVSEPGWWPPAPGWWLIAALAALGLFLIVRLSLRKFRDLRRRRAWLHALDEIGQRWDPQHQPHDYLAALNRLFRAVALRAFPESGCARMQGEEWVAFIRRSLPDGADPQDLTALSHGPYQPLPRFDAPGLQEQARNWVKHYG
jgi:hypothetical protein